MSTRIPVVSGSLLLGALPYMRDPLTFFTRVGLMYERGLAWIFLDRRTVLLVCHPNFVQDILETRTESVYQRGESMEPVRGFLGESIVTTNGPVWRHKRRLLQPVFRRERIARWTPLMLDVTVLSLRQQFLQSWVWSPLRLPLWIPLPAHRRFRETLRRMRTAVQQVIQDRRASGERHDGLLDQLLHAQDPEIGRPEEMFDVLGDQPITSNDAYRLTYSRMVFKETLRLYPPGWIPSRTAVREDTLGVSSSPRVPTSWSRPILRIAIPTGGHSPLGFDPEQFWPERSQGRLRYAHFPFGGGPHTRIGATFALVETMVILSTVMRKYVLERVPGFPVRAQPMLTIHPWPGVMMAVRPF